MKKLKRCVICGKIRALYVYPYKKHPTCSKECSNKWKSIVMLEKQKGRIKNK